MDFRRLDKLQGRAVLYTWQAGQFAEMLSLARVGERGECEEDACLGGTGGVKLSSGGDGAGKTASDGGRSHCRWLEPQMLKTISDDLAKHELETEHDEVQDTKCLEEIQPEIMDQTRRSVGLILRRGVDKRDRDGVTWSLLFYPKYCLGSQVKVGQVVKVSLRNNERLRG